MRSLIVFQLMFIFLGTSFSQPLRIAILDFDNISGITKYDGLGKAMSSMLISDIESNVSPKRLQLVERAQINKIMKEQNLQKSASFDKSTSVKMGKLLGVNFILVGDIYILDNILVINARLTNVSTGDIKFSEKQEGKVNEWLTIKTKLGKGVTSNLSMPFTEPRIPDAIVAPAVLTTYASAIDENDKGNFEKAETLINTAKEFNSEFGYLDDLKDEVEKLKKKITALQAEVETSVENPIQSAFNFFQKDDYSNAIKYFLIGLNRIPCNQFGSKYAFFVFLSEAYNKIGDYPKAIAYSDSVLTINEYEPAVIFQKSQALSKINKIDDALSILKNLYEKKDSIGKSSIFFKDIYYYSINNSCVVFDDLRIEYNSGSITFNRKIQDRSCELFLESIDINRNSKVFKLISDGYEFPQSLNLSDFFSVYATILEMKNNNPLKIASEIESLSIVDTIDLFESNEVSGQRGNIKTGRITDTGECVLAKNGQSYVGSAHYNLLSGRMYTDNSNSNFLGGASFECPCDLLINKKVYLELQQNKGSIIINQIDHALQMFNSGWYYMLGKNYKKSIDVYLSVIKYFIKESRSLDGSHLNTLDFDLYRMSTINLGHSYLLSGNFDKASETYNKDILIKDFGEAWGNLPPKEVLKNDWNDFISKGLVTKSQLTEFNNKYKIISDF